MELELTRVELLQTGLTGGRTMRLLPGPGGKNQQRVAVGDDDGVVQVALGLQIYLQGESKKSVISKNENWPWWGFFEKKNP